jgi:FKBP12-rapamycin complex-associated protein
MAGVASNVLAAIGELGEVGGEDMRAYVEDLLPLIIDTLQDQSSVAKREVCGFGGIVWAIN